jgi:hypothetical protein
MQTQCIASAPTTRLLIRELDLDERRQQIIRELDTWGRLLALGQGPGADPRLAASAERRIHPLIAELDRIEAELTTIDRTLRQRRAVREGLTAIPAGGEVDR